MNSKITMNEINNLLWFTICLLLYAIGTASYTPTFIEKTLDKPYNKYNIVFEAIIEEDEE